MPTTTSVATPTAATPRAAGELRARVSTSRARLLVLFAGPLLTYLALLAVAERSTFADTFTFYASWLAIAAWSPLPLSIPAVLLDHDRDEALAGRSWLVRAVGLVPWMLMRSAARVEMAASLVGWAALVAAFWLS